MAASIFFVASFSFPEFTILITFVSDSWTSPIELVRVDVISPMFKPETILVIELKAPGKAPLNEARISDADPVRSLNGSTMVNNELDTEDRVDDAEPVKSSKEP